jgi:F-type H+-transporting ATPase subunit b
MLTVTVTQMGAAGILVHFPRAAGDEATSEDTSGEVLDEGPSPIAPDKSELAWGLGAFLVFLVLMRLFLFPKVKRGMDARYGKIRGDHEHADAIKAEAATAVADYQAALAQVRAQAAQRIDAVRLQLESERAAVLAEVNARISEKRSAAAALAAAERAAGRGSLEDAAVGVTSRVAELSVGRVPDSTSVRDAVRQVMASAEGGAR